jgi:hypothetical protein
MLAAAPAVSRRRCPTVTRVAPTFGPLAGGTNGTSLHVLSSTKLTVRMPAHSAGTVHVRVQARAGNSPAAVVAQYRYTNKGLIRGTVTAKSS